MKEGALETFGGVPVFVMSQDPQQLASDLKDFIGACGLLDAVGEHSREQDLGEGQRVGWDLTSASLSSQRDAVEFAALVPQGRVDFLLEKARGQFVRHDETSVSSTNQACHPQ